MAKTDSRNHQIRMFLILASLLFSVRYNNADTGASVWGTTSCDKDFCITVSEAEVTAEAGLCVVIPCSFTTGYRFTPKHIVWFKCEPSKQQCSDSDMIFHTNNNNKKVQSEFKGRVSLLEPDVSQGDCSIIINDLTALDSGSYQLRVNGLLRYGRSDGYTFPQRATVSVKDLFQKPTVMVPPLTDGQQTTLTCTAPGLCSGSEPRITWMWRGTGEQDSHITGNITAFKTENLTAVTQRHSSTLTFNSSAKHHRTNVTCKVSFTGNITTEETVTLNVTYVKEVNVTGNPSVKEGETLNLTCSVESFPPSIITWTKFSDKNMQNGTETNLQNNTLNDLRNNTGTYLLNDTGMGTFSIANMTAEYSGRYICTAKHLNNTLMEKVDVTVIYMRKPVIAGDTTVEEGNALNLTCSVESVPLSHITWTKFGSNTNVQNGLNTGPQNNTGSATLFIPNVTAEHSGQYLCTAKHLNTTVTSCADITVTWFSKILNNSGCELQSNVLTCVCISEGFPLPTINWPLVKKHTEYSIINTVSNNTVNSTVTLTVTDHHSNTVECVSSNENAEAKEKLTIQTNTSKQEDQSREVMKIVSQLEVVIAFLIGVLLSAILCFLVTKCYRAQRKSSGNLDETLELVTSQEDPLIDAVQAVKDDTYYQEAAEGGAVAAAEIEALDPHDGPKEVEYASIDFSVLERRCSKQAAKKQETTETDYAEIKKEVKNVSEENGEEEGEMLECKEEEAMIGEDEETKQCGQEEEEGEYGAVCSNVKDNMSEI